MNPLLMELLSRFLNQNPAAISAAMVEELSSSCALGTAQAYALLLASACGLDIADNPAHRALYRDYFPPMLHLLNADDYRRNPYYQSLRIPTLRVGDWALCRQQYAPFEAFVCDDLKTLPDGRIVPQLGFFDEPFSFPALLEGGREWMLITPNEIATMRPAVEAARGRVLSYGLGLGYFAFMACEKPEVARVTIVERDERLIRLFNEHLRPQFLHAEKLELVVADAFDFAATRMAGGRFTVVFTDLWHDPSDGVALYLKMKAFEAQSPESQYLYWIEPTLKAYL